MKSNLAYVNEAVESAVASPPATRMEEVQIGGLRMRREVSISPEENRSYVDSARRLRESLAGQGITPLAVLPQAWWEKMCDAAGLVTVAGEQQELKVSYDSQVAGTVALGVMGWLGTSVAVAAPALHYLGDFNVVGSGVLGMMATGALIGGTWPFTVRMFARLSILASGGRDKALREIMEAGRKAERPRRVKFQLPDAPLGVADVLLRLDMSRLRVTAEPSAFQLERPLDALIRNEIISWFGSGWEKFKEGMRDPIVTYHYDGVVAVVAQWGDFPLERALVDRVIASANS